MEEEEEGKGKITRGTMSTVRNQKEAIIMIKKSMSHLIGQIIQYGAIKVSFEKKGVPVDSV